MNSIVFYPTSCLVKLDKLGISYKVTSDPTSYEAHKAFCTIAVSDEDYDRVYKIGRDEHSKMLAAAYGRELDKEV